MVEFFHMGGWGMYPTLLFGVLALGAALRYAMNPDRARLLLPAILSVVCFLAGCLAFVTGVITSITYAAGQPNQFKLIALGTSESLNNIALALALLILTGLVAAAGAFRESGRKAEPSRATASLPA